MSENKTSTPEQIPLHEVVLKVMYEANKERPADLTIAEVYQKIYDNSISEINVSDVLNWLVAQKQVERVSGKYTLDRYSFLEERAKDRGTNKKKKSKKEEETPLHEIILNLMYESNQEEPAKLTLDDVFWKVSDPKVQKSLVGDVLKWLLNQGRIEYLAGKYSLDQIEFQDQKKVSEKLAPKKKVAKKPKEKAPEKKTPEKKPKIILPPASPEEIAERKQPKPKVKPKEKTVESPSPRPTTKVPRPTPKKVEEVKEPVVEVTSQPKWRMPLVVAAVICVIYTFYLLFALNGSISTSESTSSEQVQSELTSVKAKLNELSDGQSLDKEDIAFLNEKMASLEELLLNKSEGSKDDSNKRSRSLVTRLIMALCLSFILLFSLLFGASSKGVSPKS
ncbi:MAG: DUF5457 domain-containing protein [Crocinitomicaceae bacterium]|nr:DUF5457 domain-containing protein [Crocinitomicaceae bacterium]